MATDSASRPSAVAGSSLPPPATAPLSTEALVKQLDALIVDGFANLRKAQEIRKQIAMVTALLLEANR